MNDIREIILIPPGLLRVEQPPRAEWVVDFDMLAMVALCLGGMVALIWRKRWT